MKNRGIILALAMVVTMGLVACTPEEVEPVNAPEPSSSSEPIVSSEPKETPSEAVPSDVPVSSDVKETADIESEISSGAVDTNNSTGGSNTSKPATTPSSKPPAPGGGNSSKSNDEKTDEELLQEELNQAQNAGSDGDLGGTVPEGGFGGFDPVNGGGTGGGTFTDEELDKWGSDNTDGGDADNLQQGFDPINSGGEHAPANDGTFFDGSGEIAGPGMTQEEIDEWNSLGGAPGGQ